MPEVIELISGDVVKIRGNESLFCVCVGREPLTAGSVYVEEDISVGRVVQLDDIVAVNMVKLFPGQTVAANRGDYCVAA